MQPHLSRRHVAWIDRGKAVGEQHRERRLRPLQLEGDLVIAVRLQLVEVAVGRFPRIDAQLLFGLTRDQIPRTFDILGGERFAVVPFDRAAQLQCQVLAVLAPCPALGKVGHDRSETVLRDVLVKQHEVIKDAHHGATGIDRRLFEDRHAGWAVEAVHSEHSAALLSISCGAHRQHQGQCRRTRNQAGSACHRFSSLSFCPAFHPGRIRDRYKLNLAVSQRGSACSENDEQPTVSVGCDPHVERRQGCRSHYLRTCKLSIYPTYAKSGRR